MKLDSYYGVNSLTQFIFPVKMVAREENWMFCMVKKQIL